MPTISLNRDYQSLFTKSIQDKKGLVDRKGSLMDSAMVEDVPSNTYLGTYLDLSSPPFTIEATINAQAQAQARD